METTQIYELVNSIADQTFGNTTIQVTDTASLVALGQTVLSSANNTENFLNTFVQRIGRTIVQYRKYTNSLKGLVYDDMEWGAIIQKIKAKMPQVVEDKGYELVDGQSIDQYIVNKPKATQKFFVNRTPYSCFVSIQEEQLKEAFTNANALGSFISAVFGEIQNYLEVTIENLARLTMANFMALTSDSQKINLVTKYNAATGLSITSANALYNNNFLRFAIGEMNRYKKKITSMTVIYNKEGETRHTPISQQMFVMHDDFQTACETQVQYAAFNKEYVETKSNIAVPYWQAVDSPLDINVKTAEGDKELKNIVGFLFDKEALGTYRHEESVLTTPMNARGRYTNTFWHEKQMWFNDLSENGLVFTLN